jgi:uncharacterized protein
MDARLRRIIDLLGMNPHPEGGFYKETFRSDRVVTLPDGRKRNASTGIYFLLPAGTFSAFHVLRGADEIWHHYGGEAVEIHTITPQGDHRVTKLGGGVTDGERPQILVSADTLQAAFALGTGYALCGCTVTPGFDFADLEMPTCQELVVRFPRHESVIRRFTRS